MSILFSGYLSFFFIIVSACGHFKITRALFLVTKILNYLLHDPYTNVMYRIKNITENYFYVIKEERNLYPHFNNHIMMIYSRQFYRNFAWRTSFLFYINLQNLLFYIQFQETYRNSQFKNKIIFNDFNTNVQYKKKKNKNKWDIFCARLLVAFLFSTLKRLYLHN